MQWREMNTNPVLDLKYKDPDDKVLQYFKLLTVLLSIYL